MESFCRSLAMALTRTGLSPTEALERIRNGVAGVCVQCGAIAAGEVMEALSQPATPDACATVRRLRLGDCAHPGCKSFFYRVSFQELPGTDWHAVLSQTDGIEKEADRTEISEAKLRKRAANLKLAVRVGLGMGILIALFIVRQLYYGGRIPLVREPEKFKVDVVPPGEHKRH